MELLGPNWTDKKNVVDIIQRLQEMMVEPDLDYCFEESRQARLFEDDPEHFKEKC